MRIDDKGNLILYDKDGRIVEDLRRAEFSDLSIESIRSQASRGASCRHSIVRRLLEAPGLRCARPVWKERAESIR